MTRLTGKLAALLAALLCLGTALAEGQVTATGRAFLRRGPGLDYASVSAVAPGTTLSYGETAVDERGVTWYRVAQEGGEGWICARYTDGEAPARTLTATAGVCLRAGAGSGYPTLRLVDGGTILACEDVEVDGAGVAWYRVSYRGDAGWIPAQYAAVDGGLDAPDIGEGCVTTTGSVHLRAGAGQDYASRDTVAAGARLIYDMTAEDGRGVTWYRVTSRGSQGWVSSRYAKKGGAGDDARRVRLTRAAGVRSGPGLDDDVVGVAGEGTLLTYLGQTQGDARGVAWYAVSFRGNTGWVSSRCAALLLAPEDGGAGDALTGQRWLRLGDSGFMVRIDDGFVAGELTDADRADDQVARLYSDRTALDFDVYEFSKEGLPQALADYAVLEASASPSVSELRTDGTFNGIPAAWYRTVEQYGEGEYETVTYLLETFDRYVELVFWLEGEDALAQAAAIMHTLAPVEMKAIPLGQSPYTVYAPAEYRQGGVSDAGRADGQVAYWYSAESPLDFDVYQFSKEGLPPDLADYAMQEASACAGVSGVVTDGAINGIPAAWYRTVEEYDEAECDTLTCILDAGDTYVELVFWLDADNDPAEAESMLASLTEE